MYIASDKSDLNVLDEEGNQTSLIRGLEVSDVSKITGISLWAIYRRIKKLRKTYSSHKDKKF